MKAAVNNPFSINHEVTLAVFLSSPTRTGTIWLTVSIELPPLSLRLEVRDS
ncbi:hypothetical protein SAMN06272738_6215 [Bacillus sp. JKS001846]|nr:hypothetical protein SAMN06272738_6215 [Bacillus sp. JKS001846]